MGTMMKRWAAPMRRGVAAVLLVGSLGATTDQPSGGQRGPGGTPARARAASVFLPTTSLSCFLPPPRLAGHPGSTLCVAQAATISDSDGVTVISSSDGTIALTVTPAQVSKADFLFG